MKQQIAGSNGQNKTKPEKCQVCLKSFKNERGVKIHQSKSGCKPTLKQNCIYKSKPVAGEIQEPNHSDFPHTSKPEQAASTSSIEGLNSTCSESKMEEGITLTQEITFKLREIRKDCGVLVIDDQTEKDIQRSILEEEDQYSDRRKYKRVSRELENEKVKDLIEISSEEESDTLDGHTEAQGSTKQNIDRNEKDSKKIMKDNKEVEIACAPETTEKPITVYNIVESDEETKENSITLCDSLESDEEVIGIEDIERIEDFTRMVELKGKTNLDRPAGTFSQTAPKDQKDLRQWLNGDAKIKWRDVYNLFCNGKEEDIISRGTFQLQRGDYKSLVGSNYLNDLVIEEYLDIITERNMKEGLPRIGATSVYFYPQFNLFSFEEAYQKTERWNNKNDLRQCDIILCPIHRDDHWSLVSIDTKRKTVEYYDSIIGKRKSSNAPRLMKRYIEEYYRQRGERQVFRIIVREDAPIQGNGVDCGVFLCQNAEKIARKAYVNTKQDEMAGARKRMMIELYHRRLMNPDEARPYLLSNLFRTEVGGKIQTSSNNAMKEKNQQTNNYRAPKKASVNEKSNVPKVDKQCKGRVKERKSQPPNEADTKTSNEEGQEHKPRPQDIKWPKSNSAEWKMLDEDVSKRLKIIMASPEALAEAHPKVIFNMITERFGFKERKTTATTGPSRRQKQITTLRAEIKILDKAVKSAPEVEKEGIKEIQREKLKNLRMKKRAESIRKNRRKYRKNCNDFLSQPYDFSRNLLNPKPKGVLKSTREEVEDYLHKVHSDPERGENLEMTEEMWEHEEPETEFNNKPPTYAEFTKRLRRTRTKSAPGPNGVPYRVYKRCPEVAKLLYQYLRSMWANNKVSDTWREAEGVFIPKEENASSVEKFRTISLLNVEGKLFFSLKSERILDFALANEYIDTSIQKGGVPGVSGCLEHTAVVSQLIREAKKEKKNLVVTWLDIANAYGSIPHKLIFKALREAHIPEEVVQLVESYYSNARIRFATKNYTTEWQKVEKGIITGCTLSVVLFSLAMTWIVMSVKKETKGPKLASGKVQVNSRLFMDDITTTTETMVQTSYLLEKLIKKLNWGGLYEKVPKCRALVIIKGEVSSRKIEINGKVIQPIQEQPVKYVGKWYNASLNEKQQIEAVVQGVKTDLKKVEKCRLPGRYKAWMVQHMLLPRLMWPLSIYNVPMTTVEMIQKLITKALKRWLGLPTKLSTACFYSKTSKLQFPYTELVEEVKVAKARNQVTLANSKDKCIKGAEIIIDGGRKANTPKEVEEAKSKLRMKDMIGRGNVGHEGLGLRKTQYYHKSSEKEQRDMIVKEIRNKEEERRRVKIVGQGKQGAMTRWEVPEQKLTHRDIINTSETKIKFLTKAVYDLLPTPANKNKWFGEDERCKLCNEKGTLNHILAGCKTALSQGRYTWRHNKVLQEISNRIREKAKTSKAVPQKAKSVTFVREGESKPERDQNNLNRSYLDTASDWEVRVDLNGKLKIPSSITITDLRPDMVLISESTRQLGIIELTVPNENRIEVSGELKKAKYAPIAEEGTKKGWRVRMWAVEVGCRGFPARSLTVLLRDMGYTGKERKTLLSKIGSVAEEASRAIWSWSNIKEWGKK